MKAEMIQKFKGLFESQKKSLLYSHKVLNEDFALRSDEAPDELDLSRTEIEQNVRLILRNREALFLKKIESSLEKIQAGTFGICECCEKDIELSRLEVRPTATLCISCKENEEVRENQSADGRKSKSMGSLVSLRTA